MKIILIALLLTLTACGGTSYVEEEPYLLDIEICEDQGGTAELFHVMSVDTGESYIDVQCEFAECEPIICKVGGNCPAPTCRK